MSDGRSHRAARSCSVKSDKPVAPHLNSPPQPPDSDRGDGISCPRGARMRDRLVRSCRTGFTLIELLLVIALIAVAAAVAMPRYGRAVCHYQADAAARRIVADLAAAQARAKLNSTTVTVNF